MKYALLLPIALYSILAIVAIKTIDEEGEPLFRLIIIVLGEMIALGFMFILFRNI